VSHKPESRPEALTTLRAADLAEGEIEGVGVRPLRKFKDGRGWLSELFREDEVAAEFRPAMSYVSETEPGVVRGPHEHHEQADHFCFIGPSEFVLRLWDNRPDSPTYGRMKTLRAGGESPLSVIVPAGVVHAYRNEGPAGGLVVNFPNRLYMGAGRSEPIDELRHEDDPKTIFRLDD
jgi:dTDP-4-dehydrorhamnose 3,5-epimerase